LQTFDEFETSASSEICLTPPALLCQTSLRASYRPDEARLAANDVPLVVAIGEQSAPPLREMATWLAQRLRLAVTPTPGGHVGYLTQPADVARVILPFLRGN